MAIWVSLAQERWLNLPEVRASKRSEGPPMRPWMEKLRLRRFFTRPLGGHGGSAGHV